MSVILEENSKLEYCFLVIRHRHIEPNAQVAKPY